MRWTPLLLLAACGAEVAAPKVWTCAADPAVAGEAPFLSEIGCASDFEALASEPLSASIPGARSVKTVIDRVDGNRLYFQDSVRFPIHWDFASAHVSGNGLPIVPMLANFNTTEYSALSRRFLLGAVTHYAGPDRYCYEIAPYDSATAEMIAEAFTAIASKSYFGERLAFHPTSSTIEAEAKRLPAGIPVITTDQLYEGVDYQPLNFATSIGRVRFVTAAALETEFLSFRDLVVLDRVPNDISVVVGIVTEEFQTPLSHLNVLSRNRGTPNMAKRGAFRDPALRALEGKWARLTVGPTSYTIEEVDKATADAWWEANRPAAVQVPGIDLSIEDLRDIGEAVSSTSADLKAAIKRGTRAFGGKAAHYSALSRVAGVRVPKAFAVPVYHYRKFLADHGFDRQIEAMLADPAFNDDPAERDRRLEALRDAMKLAPLDPAFEAAMLAKLRAEYPGLRVRFRSSTNAEDLDGFTGAGLYTSKSGDPNDPLYPVADAIRSVWASVWFFRAFEERSYRGIDHRAVGMALLVHNSFPDEDANGVALTNNPFDRSGLDPAFYVNVQLGEVSVVQPPAGVTTESYLHYFDRGGQPITYVSRSNLVNMGETVLSRAEATELGDALAKIRAHFAPAYARPGFWAMDVEFKLDGGMIWVKQARPYR